MAAFFTFEEWPFLKTMKTWKTLLAKQKKHISSSGVAGEKLLLLLHLNKRLFSGTNRNPNAARQNGNPNVSEWSSLPSIFIEWHSFKERSGRESLQPGKKPPEHHPSSSLIMVEIHLLIPHCMLGTHLLIQRPHPIAFEISVSLCSANYVSFQWKRIQEKLQREKLIPAHCYHPLTVAHADSSAVS
jgi:hypothetical protein